MRTNTITTERIKAAATAARAGQTRRMQALAAGCCSRTLIYWLAKGRALAETPTRRPAARRYIMLWQAVDNAASAYLDEHFEQAMAAWSIEQHQRDERHRQVAQRERERNRRGTKDKSNLHTNRPHTLS